MEEINPIAVDLDKYLNFNEIDTDGASANSADIPSINIVSPS